MIGAWMIRVVVASVFVAIASLAGERALEASGGPRRAAWIAGFVVALMLPLLGWLAPEVLPSVEVLRIDSSAMVLGASSDPAASGAPGWLPASDTLLGLAWLLCALLALGVYLAGWVRLVCARRGWRAGRVADAEVLVAPSTGPAAVGVLRPAIVVPEWLLAVDERVQRLVVLHETEHLSSRDHLLLALAPLALVIAPWNPAFWFMLRRLRLAVELDCDRRVLSRGVEAGAYGSLLLDVAGMTSVPSFGTSFAQPRSSLERRIVELTTMAPRRPVIRAVAHAGLAAALIMIAGAAAPFAVRGSYVEPRPSDPVLSATGDRYEIDGRSASAKEYASLDRSVIGHVEVERRTHVLHPDDEPEASSTMTRVFTHRYVESGAARPAPHEGPRDKIRELRDRLRDVGADVFIDDRPATFDALDALDPSRIASMVVKQMNLGGGPRAEVRVRTRQPTAP